MGESSPAAYQVELCKSPTSLRLLLFSNHNIHIGNHDQNAEKQSACIIYCLLPEYHVIPLPQVFQCSSGCHYKGNCIQLKDSIVLKLLLYVRSPGLLDSFGPMLLISICRLTLLLWFFFLKKKWMCITLYFLEERWDENLIINIASEKLLQISSELAVLFVSGRSLWFGWKLYCSTVNPGINLCTFSYSKFCWICPRICYLCPLKTPLFLLFADSNFLHTYLWSAEYWCNNQE